MNEATFAQYEALDRFLDSAKTHTTAGLNSGSGGWFLVQTVARGLRTDVSAFARNPIPPASGIDLDSAPLTVSAKRELQLLLAAGEALEHRESSFSLVTRDAIAATAEMILLEETAGRSRGQLRKLEKLTTLVTNTLTPAQPNQTPTLS